MSLYHGTRRPFRKGGLILPPSLHGNGQANHLPDYPEAADWVFVTPEFDTAAMFARNASGRGKPRVLEVTPLDPVEEDWATLWGESGHMFRTKSAVVAAVHSIS